MKHGFISNYIILDHPFEMEIYKKIDKTDTLIKIHKKK